MSYFFSVVGMGLHQATPFIVCLVSYQVPTFSIPFMSRPCFVLCTYLLSVHAVCYSQEPAVSQKSLLTRLHDINAKVSVFLSSPSGSCSLWECRAHSCFPRKLLQIGLDCPVRSSTEKKAPYSEMARCFLLNVEHRMPVVHCSTSSSTLLRWTLF